MNLTLAEAGIGAGAVLEAPESWANAGSLLVRGYGIDAGAVGPGELFFAVAGEEADGHDRVAAALARGAIGAVVARARVASLPDAALAAPLLVAEDPRGALQLLAAHVRRRWGRRLVAVAGSAGKTVAVEATAAALGAKFAVLDPQGRSSAGLGVALQLLRLEPHHEFAVVKMGMSRAGEIAALARMAAPDWGVVTNVGTAQIGSFAEGRAGIARGLFELVAALPAKGVAFLNCDDAYVSQFGRNFLGKAIYFGAGPCADPQIVEAQEDENGLRLHYRYGDTTGSFAVRLPGLHNASNVCAALAVALEAGVELEAAVTALSALTAAEGHGRTLAMGGATILDESAGSNPETLRSMIHTLASRPGRRRILVAGEIAGLGEQGPALHAASGKAAAEAGLDLVLGVKGDAEHLASAACAGGVAAIFLRSAEAAGEWLVNHIEPGDVVLVKGSPGAGLGQVIEALRAPISTSERL